MLLISPEVSVSTNQNLAAEPHHPRTNSDLQEMCRNDVHVGVDDNKQGSIIQMSSDQPRLLSGLRQRVSGKSAESWEEPLGRCWYLHLGLQASLPEVCWKYTAIGGFA